MDDHDGIILYGASGHGTVVADILEITGRGPIRFWDDREQQQFAYPVSFPDAGTSSAPCIITVGDNRTRRKLARKRNMQYVTAIHPSAVIAGSATIGDGTVVTGGVVVNPGVRIGKHCIINTRASVDHDCVLEDFVHLSPGVHLAGDVHVCEGAHIGIGSNIIQGVRIGKWATVGAGAVVIQDVPDYAVVVGVPGEVIKFNAIAEE